MAKYPSHMRPNPPAPGLDTQTLSRPEGRIAYDVAGVGQLAILVPGMGDLRSSYRFLAPVLRSSGYRVACSDLRGHGDSDATFTSYGDVDTAGDIIALIEELGGPAVIIGNSMGAGAGALAAALRPDLVTQLVLLGPFVRDAKASVLSRALLRLAMARPWAATTWKAYVPRLYAGRHPADLDEYLGQAVAALRRPGYAKAFSLTTRTSHRPVEARLSDITAPTLVVMGELDPDFPNPAKEADWIARALNREVLMVPEAGHYPQSQQPDLVAATIIDFLKRADERA